ncbi:hypothetical protein RJ639_002770 [Escallonia herrerae]|uniref:Transcription initiation factor TFIID subunit 2 n=1 Tax=Escallonia herrerae TaxID=1293975 RepID=A0AA89AYC7_9ASTE|nr:hypothetical protein RJ639_002770 [Escallonia herrerae]
MGLSYNKRKNMVELGVLRECTAAPDPSPTISTGITDTENREGGWPGMMSIRVHELDGMYDHPILPMAGETWQLLEIQCHSKLAAKRFQKPKKGSKPDVSDEIVDDIRSNADSPLLWLRADPEMEYLAEIHFNQTIQMWVRMTSRFVLLESSVIPTFTLIAVTVFNSLSGRDVFFAAFWRIRIEAAFALANIASEEAVTHLVDFYKSRRFDGNIKLPKPNDFHDFQEYFVLEYNDNNGNSYSDVFWLAALVQSIGELEFGKQNVLFLSSLLKRVDRLLQFDRLMPSYNGVLTVSCLRTLTQIALKLSGLIPLDRVFELIKPFRGNKSPWQVRIEATKALLDLEFYSKGIDAGLMLFIKYLEEELSLRGQVKLGVCALRLCQIRGGSGSDHDVKSETLVALLRLLESPVAFNNVILRHYLFCIMQVLARRPPTLFGVPRDESLRMGHAETCTELKNIFAALVKQSKAPEAPLDAFNLPYGGVVEAEARKADTIFDIHEASQPLVDLTRDNLLNTGVVKEAGTTSVSCEPGQRVVNLPFGGTVSSDPPREPDTVANGHEQQKQVVNNLYEGTVLPATPREDTVSNSRERKNPVFRIKVKQSAASSRAEDADAAVEKSQGGASSSMSVDAPQRNSVEIAIVSNQNLEDVNSCHDVGSRVTASIGSAKLASDGNELVKELQCTAESSKVSQVSPPDDRLSPYVMRNADTHKSKFASLQSLSVARNDLDSGSLAVDDPLLHGKEEDKKKKKKDKDKKRKRDDHKSKRDDPEYLERKRLKKAKKQKEKEMAKLLSSDAKESLVDIVNKREKSMTELQTNKDDAETSLAILGGEGKEASEELNSTRDDPGNKAASLQFKLGEPGGSKLVIKRSDTGGDAPEGNSSHKLKIRIKSRTKP